MLQSPIAPSRRVLAAVAQGPTGPQLEGLEDRCTPSSAGVLDPTFGNGAGYVTTSMTNLRDVAYVPLVQPYGKIIAAGTVLTRHPSGSSNSSFGVARYNSNGSLDTSFGSGGTAQASFGPNSAYCEWAALYPTAGTANDGKILLEGWYTGDLALARFNANGTLDATFGSGGEVLTPFSTSASGGNGVVVTSAGQIVTALSSGSDFVLACHNANGSLDSNFGQGGTVVIATQVAESGITQQPDGKLLVFGETGSGWLLVRYNADGSLDTSFGSGGVVNTPGVAGYPRGAAVYPSTGSPNDGKIVLVGQSGAVRYDANGALDSTFGNSGVVSTAFAAWADAIAADGKVVVVGGSTVARYNADGSPDNSFGMGGVVNTNGGGSANGVALQPNGDIVAAGMAPSSTNGSFWVARYLPQATAPYFTITGPFRHDGGNARHLHDLCL